MIFETLDNLKAFSACEFGQLFCIHYILVTCRFMETKDTRFQNKQEQIWKLIRISCIGLDFRVTKN